MTDVGIGAASATDVSGGREGAETLLPGDLQGRLDQLRSRVDEALAAALSGVDPVCLADTMRYSLLSPGKRLRPLLCLVTTGMLGGTAEQALPTACALEMLHAATLIHDDLPAMDDDDFRRGQPANHKVFGEGMALLAGDALLAYSLEHILAATRGVGERRLLGVMAELIRVVGPTGLSGGQAIDLDCQGRGSVDLATLEAMHRRKTGALIQAAVVTGAILADARPQQISCLAAFAGKIGLAYQITDDILDETATFAELGKATGRDEELGKWTFPRLLGVDGAGQRARALVDDAIDDLAGFGAGAEDLRQIAWVICRRLPA